MAKRVQWGKEGMRVDDNDDNDDDDDDVEFRLVDDYYYSYYYSYYSYYYGNLGSSMYTGGKGRDVGDGMMRRTGKNRSRGFAFFLFERRERERDNYSAGTRIHHPVQRSSRRTSFRWSRANVCRSRDPVRGSIYETGAFVAVAPCRVGTAASVPTPSLGCERDGR